MTTGTAAIKGQWRAVTAVAVPRPEALRRGAMDPATTILIPTEAAMTALGRRLALAALPGDVVALNGPLGVGKSVLARGFIRALTSEGEEVPSPTFTLLQTYDGPQCPIAHFDLYRLAHADEAIELGFEDMLADSIVLIEWPAILGPLLPERRLDIVLAETESMRVAMITARGGSTLLDRATQPADRAAERECFLAASGWGDAAVTPLPGDASFRRYFRLEAGLRRAMLMDAPPPAENIRPFIAIAEALHELGYSAPRLFDRDVNAGLLLLEDLGDTTYTRAIAAGMDEVPLYERATDLLADLHDRFAAAEATGIAAYSDALLLTEAALLTDWFLPAASGQAVPPALRAAYLAAWGEVLPLARDVPESLVLRDYHIDNLMLLDRPGLGACGLLDFQDAVIGPVAYDLVSLLEDARRDVPADLHAAMRARYLARRPAIDGQALDRAMAILGGQRHAKVIGIFCRLAIRDGKPSYLKHLPRLWRLLERSLAHAALAPVRHWFDRHVPQDLRTTPKGLG